MSLVSTDKWSYSMDGERYNGDFDTRQEAIDEAKADLALAGGGYALCEIYVGKINRFSPVVDADAVIERIQDEAYDTCGEYADGYLEGPGYKSPKEVKEAWRAKMENLSLRLTEVFVTWAKENHEEPSFFTVDSDSVERVVLTDIAV